MIVFDDPKRIDNSTVFVYRDLFKVQMGCIVSLHSGVSIVLIGIVQYQSIDYDRIVDKGP